MVSVLAGLGAGVGLVTLALTLALSIRVARLEQRTDWLERRTPNR